jgi:hypothetical protein
MRFVTDAANEALAAWDRWVIELEDHPLDQFEYEAMLSARDDVSQALEIAGKPALWPIADEIDARFRDVTIETTDSPYPNTNEGAWWWKRVPATGEALRYPKGD